MPDARDRPDADSHGSAIEPAIWSGGIFARRDALLRVPNHGDDAPSAEWGHAEAHPSERSLATRSMVSTIASPTPETGPPFEELC